MNLQNEKIKTVWFLLLGSPFGALFGDAKPEGLIKFRTLFCTASEVISLCCHDWGTVASSESYVIINH